jgi:hypothetical protein
VRCAADIVRARDPYAECHTPDEARAELLRAIDDVTEAASSPPDGRDRIHFEIEPEQVACFCVWDDAHKKKHKNEKPLRPVSGWCSCSCIPASG